MIRKTHRSMLFLYSLAHFCVDFACAFLMFCYIAGTPEGYLYVLLYNFCAFGLQMPLGVIADKLNRNFLLAVVGCAVTASAFGLVYIVPMGAVLAAGCGNAMFHIGGGIDVLNLSEANPAPLGVFVSPGAFGVYFGTIFGKQSDLPVTLILAALAVSALSISALRKVQKGYPANAAFSLEGAKAGGAVAAAVCLFFVVCMRSYIGLALNFPWKGEGRLGMMLICAAVFGKVLGGFAAGRFGAVKISVISLGIAALLFLFAQIPPMGIFAVLLFNMTMPVTLWAMAKILPGAKGFAFGMLTFGLFLGFLPVYLGVGVLPDSSLSFALLTAVSLGVIWVGLRRAKL